MSLRIVFMGTAGFAVPTLVEIVGQSHDVAAVYTRPPRPAGRGLGERKSAVHEAADRFGLPVLTPRTLRDPAALAEFAGHGADVAVVVAYGLILPPPALAAPREGCLNLHASLLPRWRGAAPIARAIMAGDAETGVAVMQMEAGLDTGPVAMVERVPIPVDATTGALTGELARLGADLMTRALAGLSRGGLDFLPQPEEGVTYAAKIEKTETRIHWDRPARAVHDHIRGLSPSPGAWIEIVIAGRPERVKVLRSALAEARSGIPGTVLDDSLLVACGDGAVRLVELQRAGGKPMPAEAFLRGAAVPAGTVLS